MRVTIFVSSLTGREDSIVFSKESEDYFAG